MPPPLAFLFWFIILILLLRYDPAKDPATSTALWVPFAWMFIMGSRQPSQWLGLTPILAETAFEEGSELDRIIYLLLIILALGILVTRHLNWRQVFARNSVLVFFLLFALASVTWSDFPFITLKRWIRDLGTYVMVLVVLSDPYPLAAISTFVRRLSCALLFLSVVLIKYYPAIGVFYNPWDGTPEYAGAATSKNMLGVICVISGLFYFWDTVERWPERRARKSQRVLFVNIVLIAMTLWLLHLSESATSRACLVLGCLIIMIVHTKWVKANSRRVTVALPVALAGYVVLETTFDVSSMVAQLLGRDPTLTGRTGIWNVLLAMQTNPFIGVGYQSFWLGDRLAAVWTSLSTGFLNEAHNGYLEVYLNLGLVGLALLCLFMIASYRTVCRQINASSRLASFSLALWVVTVFYNGTEAALGASLLWYMLLLCALPDPRSQPAMSSEASEPVAGRGRQPDLKRQATLPRDRRV